MTNSSDTNENTNSTPSEYLTNLKQFVQTVVTIILVFVIYYFNSGLILFVCKLAQSNILPSDVNCYPYTDNKVNIQSIETNIFKTYSDPPMSMKLSFPYDAYNSSNKIGDLFRSYKDEPTASSIAMYLISIIESLIAQNYAFINYAANMMNGIPEALIIILGPIIALFGVILLFLYDHLYLIYLWFAKMGWFFKKNANSEESKKPAWVDVSILNPIDYFFAIFLVMIFIGLFYFLLMVLPVLPLLTVIWCVYSSIFYKGEMLGNKVSALGVIGQMFKYYKFSFMTIISFFVIVVAFNTLGVIPGAFCVLVTVLIYFGVISINLFKGNKETSLSKVVSYHQAKKTCVLPSGTVKKTTNRGILYNLFKELFTGQTGGTILTKELKDLSKNYN
jgi:hypothetical protein